ncbi:hypothetical protein HK101_011905 [Irineochytrium annulatum]|nr:hypothetical protein HK101_011905 [Irineochytrium annulatum]
MSNPFEDESTNPFSDPSISTALNQGGATYVSVDHGLDALDSLPPSSNIEIAPMQPTGRTGVSQDLSTTRLAAKEEELRKREQELADRERALAEQQSQLRSYGLNLPNWPPFYPIIYHDIAVDIPESTRPLMNKIYKYWLGTVIVLGVNMIACLALLISHSSTVGASDFGISLIYFFTISALSFFLWYRPAYWAFSKDSALFFYIFLLFEGFHLLFAAYMAVGLPGSGSGGFINLLTVISDNKWGAGVLLILAFAGWVLDAVGAFYLWTAVNMHTKNGGHSLETARSQAITMGALASV